MLVLKVIPNPSTHLARESCPSGSLFWFTIIVLAGLMPDLAADTAWPPIRMDIPDNEMAKPRRHESSLCVKHTLT